MPRTRSPYPEEFRRKMVEIVRTGRSPYELSKEFEPTAVTISSWVKQADLDEGRRVDGHTRNCRRERCGMMVFHSTSAGRDSVDEVTREDALTNP